MERLQRKKFQGRECCNQKLRKEYPNVKYYEEINHALLGGRYLKVSSASLFVSLCCVPVCMTPRSVPGCETPLHPCLHRCISSQRCFPTIGGTAHLRECPKILNGVLEIQMQRAGAIIKADRPLC